MQNIQSTPSGRTFERFLASLALIVCVVTVARLWQVIGANQPLWLFPALYFIEVVVLSFAAWLALAITRDISSAQSAIAWCVVGILVCFVILGMMSIGFFLIPTTLLFAVTVLFAERRYFYLLPMHLVLCLIGGLAQAAVMFLIISLQSNGIHF